MSALGLFPDTTYVALSPDDEPSDSDGIGNDERLEIEGTAIDFILASEPSLQRTPTNNPGFDLYEGSSLEAATRFIEVKARQGPWSGPVAMSATQFRKAQAAGDAYWLYIVENVGTAAPTVLHRIQNPAGKARNYCLDPGWAALADPDLFEKSSPQG